MELVRLPQLGSGMTDADIISWRVSVGDTVTVGNELVEIESTKVSEVLESPYAGTVLRIFPEEGATLDVGRPLIVIGDSAESEAAANLPDE